MTLEDVLAALQPEPVFIERFAEPVRLTPEDQAPVLYALGRSPEDILVESRFSDGETFGPRALASFAVHAPDLYAQVDPLVLRQLRTSPPSLRKRRLPRSSRTVNV